MKRLHSTLFLLAALALPATLRANSVPPETGNAFAKKLAADPDANHTLSPYFQVLGSQSATAFPLQKTGVDVQITGSIAEVRLEQVYTNQGTAPIEARYVFPGSTRAAVHGMEMVVGDRTIRAEIQEKEKARATYEAAKAQNKTAALLEQKRPNVFQMDVAKIAPGQSVTVRLHYTETILPTERIYEFVFPTVVGPRFSTTTMPSADAEADAWVQNPYLKPGDPVSPLLPDFDLKCSVRAGMPVKSMKCPSHQTDIAYPDADTVNLTLAQGTGRTAGNRDFILRYQLAENKVASGLLLHQDETENTFWLTVQPPARVMPEAIPPREYLFIVDVSGSMGGFPLDTAKSLVRQLAAGLGAQDRFNIMLFAGAANVLSPTAMPATAEHLRNAMELLDGKGAGGGTNLLPALEKAFQLPGDENVSRTIVLITDGFVDCEKRAFDLVRTNLGRANFFTMGIGPSVNRFLIEGLARAGCGEPFIVTDPAACPATAKRFREYVAAPVLTDVKVAFEGVIVEGLQPASVPDVFADRPIELFGKWKGQPQGIIHVTGLSGQERVSFQFDLAEAAKKGTQNPAITTLWAREKVRNLADDYQIAPGSALQQEITALGLRYQLLTEFTSFIAVDETPRQPLAEAQTVNQPLLLPQGVSPAAVGGTGTGGGTTGTVPEPGGFLLVMLALITVLGGRLRR